MSLCIFGALDSGTEFVGCELVGAEPVGFESVEEQEFELFPFCAAVVLAGLHVKLSTTLRSATIAAMVPESWESAIE